MKKILVVLLILIFAYLGYKGYRHYRHYEALNEAKNFIGKSVKELSGVTLEGKSIKLKELKSDYIVLVFWASWCKYCINEIDEIKKFHKNQKDIKLISISIDKDINALKKLVKDKNIKYDVILDSNLTFTNNFLVVGVPSIWIVDKNLKIVAQNLRDIKAVKEFLKIK